MKTLNAEQANRQIETVIETYGEIEVLERLAATFDYLFQEGVVRPAAEQERIKRCLGFIEERISADA